MTAEFQIQRIDANITVPLRYMVRSAPSAAKQLVVLLHGYGQRAEKIMQSLLQSLPADSMVVAVNGTFPVPEWKPDSYKEAYAWYFFEPRERLMVLPPEPAALALRQLVAAVGAEGLPKRIIGFSQGGNLAPLVAQSLKDVRQVLGIGCGYREDFFPDRPSFRIDAVHGRRDPIIEVGRSRAQHDALKEKGWIGEFVELADTEHKIDVAVADAVRRLATNR